MSDDNTTETVSPTATRPSSLTCHGLPSLPDRTHRSTTSSSSSCIFVFPTRRRLPHSAILLVSLIWLSLLVMPTLAQRYKRCFVCRSRGPLGSCRDPFESNTTLAEHNKAISLDPCASGWCGKVIEGKEDDHLQATERFCLQRPPDDNVETCAESALQNRKNVKLYVCLCRGDLCNGSLSGHLAARPSLLLAALGTLSLLVGALLTSKGDHR